ncbi:orotate phosphoribosyltransferase [bacterium]|nr:MAG: orotate phosphoribosyltransferase [bacterium]
MKLIDKVFAEELALSLLQINAVLLRPNEPFVWASGWNSPIYCDNRLTLSHPAIRKKIAAKFAEHIQARNIDVITGTATAGIPHAAWVADILNKPMAYVRSKAKSYGMGNQIEGGVKKGESTIVIEDLVSTGGSAMSVIDVLEFVGAKVPEICAIFTYGFDVADKAFEEKGIEYYALTDYETLIQVAEKHGYVDSDDIELLNQWRLSPSTWPKTN